MRIYDGQDIRNVALIGHGDTGKTQLVSALLYAAGMVNRLGKVDDGTSTTDYDEEEIQRKFSITAGLAYAEWGKTKINFIDTPGYNIFMHETEGALLAADAALLLIHAVAGIEVQTEKSWGFCEKYGLPRALVINQMDRDRASFERTLEAVHKEFGRNAVPVQLPIGEEKNFHGVIDLVRMKAYLYDSSGSGKAKEGEIPAELKEAATKAHEALVEMVAEGNDKLMEEFFEQGHLAGGALGSGPEGCGVRKAHLPGGRCRRASQHGQRESAECSSWTTFLRRWNGRRWKVWTTRAGKPSNARLPTTSRLPRSCSRPWRTPLPGE